MDIGTPIKDLGPVESTALREAILALDDSAWRETKMRQEKYREVHYNTESVILVFCDHDSWPRIEVIEGAGWARLSSLALPVMHDIIGRFYPKGGTII